MSEPPARWRSYSEMMLEEAEKYDPREEEENWTECADKWFRIYVEEWKAELRECIAKETAAREAAEREAAGRVRQPANALQPTTEAESNGDPLFEPNHEDTNGPALQAKTNTGNGGEGNSGSRSPSPPRSSNDISSDDEPLATLGSLRKRAVAHSADSVPAVSSLTSPTGQYAALPRVTKKERANPPDEATSPTDAVMSPASVASGSENKSSDTRVPPAWYAKVDPNKIPATAQNRALWSQLQKIRNLIANCQDEHARSGGVSSANLNKVRDELHRLEYTKVDEQALATKRLLDNERGLPQIFDKAYTKEVEYPWDIAADALLLYNKWSQRFLDPDLLRGIKAAPKNVLSKEKSAWSIEPKYPLRVDAHYFGEECLVNGQWWPRQICAVRDGAHGEMIAGITGPSRADAKRGLTGAVSVVMSGSEYHAYDKDEGDVVWYCGTKGKAGEPSESTQHMLDAVNSGRPVQLMRSAGLAASNPWKPSEGFRYDGLYDVVAQELLDAATSFFRFKLVRRPGQPPIRSSVVSARPTQRELNEWHILQKQLGMKGGNFD